ncbi:unnamed protein product, partial [Didymodactylos carnosus]
TLLKLKSTQYVVVNNPSGVRSNCWKIFGLPTEVIDEPTNKTNIIKGFASCRKCYATLVYDSKSIGNKNLNDHNCVKSLGGNSRIHDHLISSIKPIPLFKKQHLSETIAEWSSMNSRPFRLVEGDGFKKVVQELLSIGHIYGPHKSDDVLPCANTVKNKIEELAQNNRTELSKKLIYSAENQKLSLSPDLWTDSYVKQTYLGMTAHFVHEFESHSVDLGCREFLYEKKTAENVSLSIDNLLHEFNLKLYRDEIPFVIDRG